MDIKSHEHIELMDMFERTFKGERFDREPKNLWPMGVVYCDGHVNKLFDAYRKGYAFHKALANLEAA